MSLIQLSATDNPTSEAKLLRLTVEMERLNELRQQVILQEQKVQKLHISGVYKTCCNNNICQACDQFLYTECTRVNDCCMQF